MPKRYNSAIAADSPARKRATYARHGQPPLASQDPLRLAELHDRDGTIWYLTQVRANIGSPGKRLKTPEPMEDSEWRNCKLHAFGVVPHKANYWVSISPRNKRISARWDARPLMDTRPALYQALLALTQYWPLTPGLDEDLTVRVKPRGDVFTCEDILTTTDVMAQLDQLLTGGFLNVDCTLDMLKAAVLMLPDRRFKAEASLFKGFDVTRVS